MRDPREEDEMTVKDNPARKRYELDVDGETAVVYYELSPAMITFTHTEVPKALEGRGVGSRLARGALEDARSRGLKIVPQCDFIRAYLEKHPELANPPVAR